MKPLDLDTLLNLENLEIAQLAHHLRPIFGLVTFQVSCFNFPPVGEGGRSGYGEESLYDPIDKDGKVRLQK